MRRTVTTVTTAMKQRQQQKGPNGLQEVSNRARGSFELSFSAPVKSDNSQALLKPSKGLLWFLGGPESFLEAVQGLPGASGGCRGRPEKPQEGPKRAPQGPFELTLPEPVKVATPRVLLRPSWGLGLPPGVPLPLVSITSRRSLLSGGPSPPVSSLALQSWRRQLLHPHFPPSR